MRRFTILEDDEVGAFINSLVGQHLKSFRSELIRGFEWEAG